VGLCLQGRAQVALCIAGIQAQGAGSSGALETPSCRAACCHGLRRGAGGAGAGAVWRMKRSSAATTAAASSGEAFGATIVSFGRRFT
jgi:hypothetical protein